MFKLGKNPARLDAVKIKLKNYLDTTALPEIPSSFGHEKLIENNSWGMLGNDQFGDCVWAGAAHETMLWNKEAGKVVDFSEQDVLSDYSVVTGFNPNDPTSDNGTDMQVAASYRKKKGIKAEDGRHLISAYLALEVGNKLEHKTAIYLFNAVGIGIQFPDYAMEQFNSGQSWHLKSGGKIIGGHYVPAFGYSRSYIYVVSWGKIQKMTWGFFSKYNDESIVYLSKEMFSGNKTLGGFDYSTLESDLSKL